MPELPDPLKQQQIEHRLASYVAWCLWNDLESWRKYMHPANLRAVFDPKPAREFARRFGPASERLGVFSDDFETFTDAEAARDLEDARLVGRSTIEFLENVLSDPQLRSVADTINDRRPRSFFELLDENEDSILDVLVAQRMRPGMSIYSKGSAAIHGSSIEAVMYCQWPLIGPQIWAEDDDIRDEMNTAVGWARSCALMLYLLLPSRGNHST